MANQPMLTYIVGKDNLVGKFLTKHKDLFTLVNDIALARVVVFTGGADINPILYNEDPIKECGAINHKRDQLEVDVWDKTEKPPFIKIGICRGAQFLNVMNGGSLWQHVNNHGRSHPLDLHETKSFRRKGIIAYKSVTSTHHQMMRPSVHNAAEVIGNIRLSTLRKADRSEHMGNIWNDPEIIFYPNTNSLCFQPHPEYDELTGECFRHVFTNLTFLEKAPV